MGYTIAQPSRGLGTGYDPATWFASAPDDAQTAQTAGNVRYVLQLYQWSRQTRLWGNTKKAQILSMGDNAPAGAYDQVTQILNGLVDLENQLAPYMRQIQDQQRQLQGIGWQFPTDWGFRWDGWEGDDTTPPTAPPDPSPITKDEAQADAQAAGLMGYGSSYILFALGAALVVAGLLIAAPFAAIGAIVVGLVTASLGVVAMITASPGGQEAIAKAVPAAASNLTSGVGQGLSNGLSMAIPIAAIAVAWFYLSGGKRGKSRGATR